MTFTSIVKQYSGDMPVRAVLDELERVGAVVRTADGHVQLKTQSYLPKADGKMKLHILGSDVGKLISTIGHNMEAEASRLRLQRKVSYDNLPNETIAPFRRYSKAQAVKLLEKLDAYLCQYDRDTNSEIQGTGRNKVA